MGLYKGSGGSSSSSDITPDLCNRRALILARRSTQASGKYNMSRENRSAAVVRVLSCPNWEPVPSGHPVLVASSTLDDEFSLFRHATQNNRKFIKKSLRTDHEVGGVIGKFCREVRKDVLSPKCDKGTLVMGVGRLGGFYHLVKRGDGNSNEPKRFKRVVLKR